jgi:hypothetical protein
VYRLLIAAAVLLLTACSETTPAPEPAVSAEEASKLLFQVADQAAKRTSAGVTQICGSLADSCDAMSSAWRADPKSAPLTRPSVVCDVALPATAEQAGPRLLVVTGRDSGGRGYAGQVLVERRDGRPIVHEPAFWLGIEYTSLLKGRAWNGANNVGRAEHEADVRRACTAPAAFVARVATTGTG